jgi:hypothetical protein
MLMGHFGALRDALSAVNPFTLWNIGLDGVILYALCKFDYRLATVIAVTILIAFVVVLYAISRLTG